jgi:hypothetical protein
MMNRVRGYLEKLDGLERADARRTAHQIVTRLTPAPPWDESNMTPEKVDEIMLSIVSAIGPDRAGRLIRDLLVELAADDAALAD